MKSSQRLAVFFIGGVACFGDGASPERRLPASLEIVTAPSSPATAGSPVGTLSVVVRDEQSRPLSGVVTTFTVTAGGARVVPVIDTTDGNGQTATQITLGTIPGPNQISAVVRGLAPVRIDLTSVAGSTRSLTLNARFVRLRHTDNGVTLVATPRDASANITNEPVGWISRDPTLVSVSSAQSNSGAVTVQRRPGQTFVVATSGTASDSVRIVVQDASSSPCDFAATPRTLDIGDVMPMDSTLLCIRANEANHEYALVAHYNTALTFVTSRMTITGFGVTAATAAATSPASPALLSFEQENDFEASLRAREASELPPRVEGAREWHARQKRIMNAASPSGISGALRLGDVIPVNVNARDFCDNPTPIDARVVAVTNGSIILADTANPAGGFTANEYFELAMATDTLIAPVTIGAFGAPADIDNNGRITILFTKAVNQLTARGSAGIVVGFYYVRDLLPRISPFGTCEGSNVSEMFYLMAPDPDGQFSDIRSKADVKRRTLGTIAHEFQHLINASRRMYLTMATQVNEEPWLNEGLSHIAEELIFFHASGHSPRQNLDGSQLALGSISRELFDQYLSGNFGRFRLYAIAPEATSPFLGDAQLTTRGAAWSFLRYVADRKGADDGDFWHRLVNSNLVGTPNLDAALRETGMTSTSALADWGIAVLTDDSPGVTNPTYQHATWNYPSVMPATGISLSYPLLTRALTDGQGASVALQAGGNAYLTFGVPESAQALLQLSSASNTLPAGVRLTLVRIK